VRPIVLEELTEEIASAVEVTAPGVADRVELLDRPSGPVVQRSSIGTRDQTRDQDVARRLVTGGDR
jgi:hypothetical protein